MRPAELLTLVYFVYLALVGAIGGRPRARALSLAALAIVAAVQAVLVGIEGPPVALARDVWPLIVLVAGYRLAGLFYDAPDTTLEARLLGVDRWIGDRLRAVAASPRGPLARVAREGLEAAYLGVYLLIPLGALVVARASTQANVDRYWAAVLASGFVCYGALPWIQTRPPRIVQAVAGGDRLRRVNLALLEHGSVGVNTLPSGHAATAVATALAVTAAAPAIGALFLIVAALIALATIVGRYHYTVDTVLGALVGVLAWAAFSR